MLRFMVAVVCLMLAQSCIQEGSESLAEHIENECPESFNPLKPASTLRYSGAFICRTSTCRGTFVRANDNGDGTWSLILKDENDIGASLQFPEPGDGYRLDDFMIPPVGSEVTFTRSGGRASYERYMRVSYGDAIVWEGGHATASDISFNFNNTQVIKADVTELDSGCVWENQGCLVDVAPISVTTTNRSMNVGFGEVGVTIINGRSYVLKSVNTRRILPRDGRCFGSDYTSVNADAYVFQLKEE